MKLIKYILGLLSIVLIQSCVEENFMIDNDNIDIVASVNHNTRTTYSSQDGITYVSWAEGDAIGLFANDFKNLQYTAEHAGTVTSFCGPKLDVAEGDAVYAYYPYNQAADSFVQLPDLGLQSQNIGLNGYDCMYAVGVVKNRKVELEFQHLFAILKLVIPTEKLSEIRNNRIDCISSEPCSVRGGQYNIETKSYGTVFNDLTYYFNRDSLRKETVTCYIAVLPQSEDAVLEFTDSPNGNVAPKTLFVFRAPKGGFKAGCIYNLNLSEERINSRKEKDIEALTALYNATGGKNWTNQLNWFTDKPIYEWYGLGNSKKYDFVKELNLEYNNLKGTLPAEFTYWMDNVKSISLKENYLSGKIPSEVMQHPRWNEVGWNIIHQYTNEGYGFDLSNGSNLYEKNLELELLNGDKIMSHDLFKKNKISLVCNNAEEYTVSIKRANLLLSYRNKGFEIVVAHLNDELEDAIREAESYPIKDGITRLYGRYNNFSDLYMRDELAHCRSFFLIDENASVIEFFYEKVDVSEIVAYNDDKLQKILYERLGEPEDHEEFIGYTSTDYKLDGTVVTLQKASVGKGIDLVFMGDGYVDIDMAEGGKYEKHMRESMEYFFGIEPYKSFRNRFNVYAVKVISPNDLSVEGGKQKINYSDKVCFEYAEKIQGVDMNNVTIVNVVNHPDDFIAQGYANMYDSGASVSHIQIGGPSKIIVHEAGGHGFAKLLDEYISGNNQVSAENLSSFQNWLKTEYHNKGWGVNLDATDDPETVIWSHFLKDSRYAGEVGIYKGAWDWPDNLWRSSDNSVMNNDYTRFNAPSREAIYKRIMKLSEGEDWVYSYENFVEYDKINRNSNSSSISMQSYSKDKIKLINHQPPIIIKGTWRDALK